MSRCLLRRTQLNCFVWRECSPEPYIERPPSRLSPILSLLDLLAPLLPAFSLHLSKGQEHFFLRLLFFFWWLFCALRMYLFLGLYAGLCLLFHTSQNPPLPRLSPCAFPLLLASTDFASSSLRLLLVCTCVYVTNISYSSFQPVHLLRTTCPSDVPARCPLNHTHTGPHHAAIHKQGYDIFCSCYSTFPIYAPSLPVPISSLPLLPRLLSRLLLLSPFAQSRKCRSNPSPGYHA